MHVHLSCLLFLSHSLSEISALGKKPLPLLTLVIVAKYMQGVDEI